MSSRAITLEYWTQILQEFRAAPGQHGRVARIVGCDSRTARKAWLFGFKYGPKPCQRPIKLIVDEEQELARSEMARAQATAADKAAEAERLRKAEVQERARKDAIEARTQEAAMVRLARGNAMQLLGGLIKMTQGVGKLATTLDKNLERFATDPVTGEPRKMSAHEMHRTAQFLSSVSTALRQATDASCKAMEMERVLLGEPTKIIGVQVESMTMREAAHTVRLAMEAAARLQARGMVIDAVAPATSRPALVPTPITRHEDNRPLGDAIPSAKSSDNPPFRHRDDQAAVAPAQPKPFPSDVLTQEQEQEPTPMAATGTSGPHVRLVQGKAGNVPIVK